MPRQINKLIKNMDYKFQNLTKDKENCLMMIKASVEKFLSHPSTLNFNGARNTIVVFGGINEPQNIGINHIEQTWIDNITVLLYLFYKNKTKKDAVDTMVISNCLPKLIERSQIYDCYELVSVYGLTPPYNIAAAYYNQTKKIEFIRLCMKRWEDRFANDKRKRKGHEAILKYYLGGVVSCFISFETELDNGSSLTAQEYYYYCLTSKILGIEFEQISSDAMKSISDNDFVAQYYKGLICLLRDNKEEARQYFKESSADFEYSKILYEEQENALVQPYGITIDPEKDDYSVFDDYIHYFECYLAFNNINQIPGLYNAYKGDTLGVENKLKEHEAYLLSQYMHNDLYGREVKLTEEEYNKRINHFNQILINKDGFARELFLDTEEGIDRLPVECAEHQIALTIKMYRYKNWSFYAYLIYYFYFKQKIDREAVIYLSLYVTYVAEKILKKDLAEIATGTVLSLMALRLLTPFYDWSIPIQQLLATAPFSLTNTNKSEYEEFKKIIKKRMLEIRLQIGDVKFENTFRFMTIIDKMKQIDGFINGPEFDNPTENMKSVFADT